MKQKSTAKNKKIDKYTKTSLERKIIQRIFSDYLLSICLFTIAEKKMEMQKVL